MSPLGIIIRIKGLKWSSFCPILATYFLTKHCNFNPGSFFHSLHCGRDIIARIWGKKKRLIFNSIHFLWRAINCRQWAPEEKVSNWEVYFMFLCQIENISRRPSSRPFHLLCSLCLCVFRVMFVIKLQSLHLFMLEIPDITHQLSFAFLPPILA